MTPSASPKAVFRLSGVFDQTAAMTAAQMGEVAFKIDSSEADSVLAAKANNRKGTPELMSPKMMKWRQCARISKGLRRINPTADRKTAAKSRRNQMSRMGPKTGTLIRMNRNEPPQMAESPIKRMTLARFKSAF